MAAKHRYSSLKPRPGTRKKPLAEAVAALLFGIGFGHSPVRAELPVPADVLVAPGNGSVLPPVVEGNTMTIRQRSDKAILDWKSFNIGPENTVRFRQPSSTSVALNNIHQSDPSQILGTLSANGQVYLINQNGFVFGREARINVNTLVASTLSVSEEALQKGLSKMIVKNGDPALTSDGNPNRIDANGQTVTDAQGQPLKREILIEQGAKLATPSGGRIMIFAPSVVNKGKISTPDGQTIIAAATDKVYLQEADSVKTGVRGLLVEVNTGGKVENLGKITARRGNITLEGFAVNQNGLVSATTSVRLNGSVRLLAREKGGNPVANIENQYVLRADTTRRDQDNGDGLGTSARVVLGKNSVTQVVPETRSRATAVDDQTQDASWIEVMGRKVELQENSRLAAPAGKVSVVATVRPDDPNAATAKDPEAAIDIKPGARIDVAGLKNVRVPVSKNIVEVELRSFELRDSPLQKDKTGALYGQKVYVDVRDSKNGRIPLADISGSIARIERTIAERSLKGGSISLSSAGSVNVGQDSTLDISGGSTQYLGGFVKTSALSSGGRYYEVGKADPNRIYDGILGKVTRHDKKWGVSQSWDIAGPVGNGRFEEGYIEGADAGSLNIRTDHLTLDGQIDGHTIEGPRQRETGQRATGSSLTIDLGFSPQSAQPVVFVGETRAVDEQLKALSTGLGNLLQDPLVIMDHYLQRSGIRKASITTHGVVAVSPDAHIDLADEGGTIEYTDAQGNTSTLAGGGLSLSGGQVEFQGQITAPSGLVELKTEFNEEGLPDIGVTGGIHMAPGSRIDVSGQWTNDLPARTGTNQATGPILVDGGKVTVAATGDLSFDAGSEIAADGGAWLNANGKLIEGKGGDISLSATMNSRHPVPELGSRQASNLSFEGWAHAFGLHLGGSLSLTTNQILIGDSFTQNPVPGGPLSPLVLDPVVFTRGGFRSYALTADFNGLEIGYDTELRLQGQNLVLGKHFQEVPTGGPLAALSTAQVLPDGERSAVNLNLTVKHPSIAFNTQGGLKPLRIDAGAVITGDPGASIKLQSDSQMLIEGTIRAPAGKIQADITIHRDFETAFDATQGIFLGEGARLEALGVVLPTPGGVDLLRDDRVLNGGSITLNANRGYIVLDTGARLDVSGAAAVVDQTRPQTNRPGFKAVALTHASKAGSISLSAAEGMALDGQLVGKGQGVEGGRLSVSLLTNRSLPSEPLLGTYPTASRVIELRQSAQAGFSDSWTFGTAIPNSRNGLVNLSADQIEAGGFDSLDLHADDQIRFVDTVNLSTGRRIGLDTTTLVMTQSSGQGKSAVQINAPYIALGSSQFRELSSAASSGSGRFGAAARDLELIGGLRLQGIGDTRLLASRDLRLRGIRDTSKDSQDPEFRTFRGTLLAAGDLTLAGSQVYPATLTQYAIKLSGTGRLSVLGGNRERPILSAAGRISVEAPNIDVAGAIKAPFGDISLTATDTAVNLLPGARLSVSAEGKTIPFGITQGGLDWLFPIGNGVNVLYGLDKGQTAPPSGRIQLTGDQVNIAKGAQVDLSGGGDLYAHEFLKGSGGSVDLLDPDAAQYGSDGFSYQEKYAIVPWLKDSLAPYDPYETPKYDPSTDTTGTHSLRIGDTLTVADGVAGLAPGKYTLLPAAYALLPGAYVVTPNSGTANAIPGQINYRLDGVPVVAARYSVAGTRYADFGWRGFAVQSGQDFRKLTDYAESKANDFFTAQAKRLELTAPSLPRDAGRLLIDVGQRLSLDGEVKGDPGKGGRGGQLDIAATNLRVIPKADGSTSSNAVVLGADQLDRLKVESLLLGGIRQEANDGSRRITVRSGTVTIAADTTLTAPDIMLAATDRVEVGSGAKLQAEGTLAQTASNVRLANNAGDNSDGAFLRVSAGGQIEPVRDKTVTGGKGTLDIAADAVLAATGSITADATGANSRFAGQIDMAGGSLFLGASRINLGAGSDSGLTLSGEQLGALTVDELILRSASEVRTYGPLAITTKLLDIRAAGIFGYANAGGTASLSADQIKLSNPGAATATPPNATDGGSVRFSTQRLAIQGGQFALRGYNTVDFAASDRWTFGTGSLVVDGDLRVNTPMVLAQTGADFTLDVTGHDFALTGAGRGDIPAAAGLAAKFAIRADRIDLNSKIALPSGLFSATAQDDLTLGAGGSLALAGISQTYAGKTISTPGGQVVLVSSQGNINLAAGGGIDISAPDQAGSLSLSAPQGTATLDATLKGTTANAGGRHASLNFDLGSLADRGASAFAYLKAVDGAQDFGLRLRQGELALAAGEQLQAHTFNLSADTGQLTVAGTLDVSGTTPGAIALAAGDRVRLASTARLLAGVSADNRRGGKVFIESVDRDEDGISGIVAESGAVIAVRGGLVNDPAKANDDVDQTRYLADGTTVTEGGKTYFAGDIHLRALRTGNGVNINFQGQTQGAAEVVAEAVRVYTASTLDADQIAAWQAETKNYMAGVNPAQSPGLTVMPGLEIRSAGTMTLAAEGWNFLPTLLVDQPDGSQLPELSDDWRYGSGKLPGFLTLRAGGDVILNGKLSDGVAAGHYSDGQGGRSVVNEAIQSGRSWSFRLVSGADAQAADSSRTVAGVGDLSLAADAVVRTGTGRIELAAGKDFRLGGESAAVYTVGQVDSQQPFGSMNDFHVNQNFWAQYPVRGGDITITAGGDIYGAPTRQLMADWLVRTGNWGDPELDPSDQTPVAWGIALDAVEGAPGFIIDPELRGFKQNVGALAGGDIRITAGGRIKDLMAVIPTVGKQVGQRLIFDDPTKFGVKANQVEVHGGGQLTVNAGGDIAGGLFYVEKGAGQVVSQGAITGGSQYSKGPLFVLGDATLEAAARSGVEVGTVFNAFLLKERFQTDISNYFATYSDKSRVDFSSLVGDINVNNDLNVIAQNYVTLEGDPILDVIAPLSVPGGPVLYYYPGTLTAHAYSGSITFAHSLVMAPSAQGQLELFAEQSIQSASLGGGNRVDFNMTDIDAAATVPGSHRPVIDLGAFADSLNPGSDTPENLHAPTPVHTGDSQPVLIATQKGDIKGNDFLNFYLPKSLRMESGRDIRDVNLDIQNLAKTDVSQISAQRDIAFTILRNEDGGLATGQAAHIRMAGPGELQVLAGRNIDLGSSDGITSIGNTRNANLPDLGAALTLIAGLSDRMDLAGFLKTYGRLNTTDGQSRPLTEDEIAAMTPLQQLQAALPVLFDVLREAGVEAIKHENPLKYYEPGYKAIKTLFPGDKYQGDINLFFSRIHTLVDTLDDADIEQLTAAGISPSTRGGITLLTPGGLVNAGLTNSSLGQKEPGELGIVAQQNGAISAYVKDDFTVNESRVFTQGGGDITIWAGDGDIDAGRGAKSALSAPPPQVVFDANGNPKTIFPPILSGSGIRTATSDEKNQPAGNVYLFAPRGVIDAGDAGIGGKNLFAGAERFLNQGNIQVTGTTSGVPTSAPPVVVPAAAAGAAAAAANSASQQVDQGGSKSAADKNKDATRDALRAALQTVQVDVVGFGNCSFEDIRGQKPGCGGEDVPPSP